MRPFYNTNAFRSNSSYFNAKNAGNIKMSMDYFLFLKYLN